MAFSTLWMACVILPLCLEAQQSAPEKHTLYYVYTALSNTISAPGIFEFTAMGLLDDRKIDYYDSKDKVKTPQQDWMKERLPEDYWEKGTQSRKSKEQWFKVNVNILMERMRHNTSDLHVLMWRHGCEVQMEPDGKSKFVRGVDEYSYDGMDFLSFDDASMNWVAPVSQAVPTKAKWDGVPILNQYTKGYLEKECVDWLDKFRSYSELDVKQKMKITPPEVRLFAKQSKVSDAVTLTCMASGFYPKDIEIAILKNNLVMKKGDVRDVLPNGDGTHQIRLSVEVGRAELPAYTCEVNHIALEKKLQRSWPKDGELCFGESSAFTVGLISGVLVTVLVVAVLGVLAFKRGIISFDNGFKFHGFGQRACIRNGNNSNGNHLNVVQVAPLLNGQQAQKDADDGADDDSGKGSPSNSNESVNDAAQG